MSFPFFFLSILYAPVMNLSDMTMPIVFLYYWPNVGSLMLNATEDISLEHGLASWVMVELLLWERY